MWKLQIAFLFISFQLVMNSQQLSRTLVFISHFED